MLLRRCLLGIWLMSCLVDSVLAELHLLTEDAPPANYSRDGGVHGLAVDLVRALSERTGDAARIDLLPWTRAYNLAQKNADTAVFSTVRTPEREGKFQWVGPLLIGTTSFYSLKARNLQFENMQQVAQSGPLALPRQWHTFETLSGRGFTNLYGVSNPKTMVTMLKHGRVQLIATEDLALEDELSAAGLRVDQVQAHLPFMRSAYYIAFSPQTDAAVVLRWRRELDVMHQDGSFAQIFRRWLPHAEMPTATE